MAYRKKILLLFLAVTAFAVFAASDKSKKRERKDSIIIEDEKREKPIVFVGEWKLHNRVKKLYDTPLGAVYDLTMNPYYDFFDNRYQNSLFDSLQFDILDKIEEKKLRRFIVVDFKIRVFPADNVLKVPAICFTLTRGDKDDTDIKYYSDLTGISYFRSDEPFLPPLPEDLHDDKRLKRQQEVNLLQIGHNDIIDRFHRTSGLGRFAADQKTYRVGFNYYPNYEIMSVRFIFDSTMSNRSMTSICINGLAKKIMTPREVYAYILPHRTFGICLQKGGVYFDDKVRNLLEISPPTITLINQEDKLRELPQLKLEDYPYGGYLDDKKNKKKSNNPDAVYSLAKRIIDSGDNLPEGIKLLEKAVVDHHVFAMYQLGLCYRSGIGVEPDRKKADFWLNKAALFGLPDAAALNTMWQFQTFSPYMSQADKAKIRESLNAVHKWNGKHDNWLMSMIFLDMTSCLREIQADCSDKVMAWFIFNRLAPLYYCNNVSPETVNERSDNLNGKKRPPYTLRIRRALPDAMKFKGVRIALDTKIKEFPDEVFYDKRVMHEIPHRNWAFKGGELDTLIAHRFSPAMLYKGRILAALLNLKYSPEAIYLANPPLSPANIKMKPEDATREALKLFDQGAKLGNAECSLEAMYCRASLGELKMADFTAENDMRFAGYPLYYMLRHMVEHPDAPGTTEFLARNFNAARDLWKKDPTPINNFLLGAEMLYQFYHYGFDSAPYRIYYGDVQDVFDACKYLDVAAEAKIIPALYLTGCQFLDGFRRKTELSENNNDAEMLKTGARLLETAAEAGHLGAQLRLVKFEAERTRLFQPWWIDRLDGARKANNPEAWRLTAELLDREPDTSQLHKQKVLDLYEKAAGLGSIAALNHLARRAYSPTAKDNSVANAYWRKALELDRKARLQDPYDPLCESIKPVTFDFKRMSATPAEEGDDEEREEIITTY